MELTEQQSCAVPEKPAQHTKSQALSFDPVERLSICTALIDQQQLRDAVAIVCDTTAHLMNQEGPYQQQFVSLLASWPGVGTTVGLDKSECVIQIQARSFSLVQAQAYVRFLYCALNIVEIEKSSSSARYVNELLLRFDALAEGLSLPRSGRDRRYLLFFCSYIKHFFGLYTNSHNKRFYEEQLLAGVSKYLREPVAVTKNLLTKNQVENRLVERRRNKGQHIDYIRNYGRSFKVGRLEQYRTLLKNDKRSRILASFHMGDYVYGIHRLLSLEPKMRKLHIVRQQSSSFPNYNNFLKATATRRLPRNIQILSSDFEPVKMAGLLRSGNTSLAMLCDLPSLYGETVTVNFLGRSAQFPKGPAALAMVAKVPLLPVINYFDGRNNHIHIGNMVESQRKQNESSLAYTTRLTQSLVSFFESFFMRYPEQWRYLPALPSYFDSSNKPLKLAEDF